MAIQRNQATAVGSNIIGSAALLGVGLTIMAAGSRVMQGFGSVDNFAPLALGGLFAFGGSIGLVRALFRVNRLGSSLPSSAQPTEASNFDADAAIERYLATRSAGAGPRSVQAEDAPTRPSFGRRRG